MDVFTVLVILCVIIPLIVAILFLLLVFWLINRLLLDGKFKLLYRIILSTALPIISICCFIAYTYYEPYRTTTMNNRLEEIGIGIKLPRYKIIEYNEDHVGGDDFEITYTLMFKDDKIKELIPQLDSLCNANDKWEKDRDSYIFTVLFFEQEVSETLYIKPDSLTAKFVYYKW